MYSQNAAWQNVTNVLKDKFSIKCTERMDTGYKVTNIFLLHLFVEIVYLFCMCMHHFLVI